MDDYSIIRDEYFYIKEKAFKDIGKLVNTDNTHPVREHEENVPEKRKKSEKNREASLDTNRTDFSEKKDRSRGLFCPMDSAEMKTLLLENIYIDYCPACYGIWLDFGELERLLQKRLDKTALFREKLLYKVHDKPERPLRCPLCDAELDKHRHYEAGITSDVCSVCGGVWLDSGEFAALYLEKRHEESAREILAGVLGRYVDIDA
ncbi:MAG: zf-TFIIB domain-containing protein [Spirochaetales bacterium]|nr:zf-TFIIB domain-containing protein [Spirochaetales bacterium]